MLNLKPSAEGLVKQQPGLELRANGNQARIATGVKRISPIMYSDPLVRALTDPQNPRPFTKGLHDCDICSYNISKLSKEYIM